MYPYNSEVVMSKSYHLKHQLILCLFVLVVFIGSYKFPVLMIQVFLVITLFIACMALNEWYAQWKIEYNSREVMIGYLIGTATIDLSFRYSEQLYFSTTLENNQYILVCITPQQAQWWRSITIGTKMKIMVYKKDINGGSFFCKSPPIIVG